MNIKLNVAKQIQAHLLEQGCRSQYSTFKGAGCAYRGDGGTKCAVGFIVTDQFYTPDLEGLDSRNQEVVNAVCSSLEIEHLTDRDLNFLLEMQGIHDRYEVTLWEALTDNLIDRYFPEEQEEPQREVKPQLEEALTPN